MLMDLTRRIRPACYAVLARALRSRKGEKQMARSLVEIVRNPEMCAGDPTLAGTRTTVHDIVSYVQLYGGDLERAHEEELPYLSIEQIRAVMEWYRANSGEIDEILRSRREDYERGLAEVGTTR
jgi:uncharacterized protein (DUF433 family)